MRHGAMVLVLALAACAGRSDDRYAAGSPPASATVASDLRDAAGRTVAVASATQESDGIRVRIESSALPPGAHGAHVHMIGVCTPPAFDSAGAHWNPTRRQHGSANPQGPHEGDLPNLLVGADGRGTLEYRIDGGRVGAMMDEDGAALVIHAQADDYRTDPSGNSGARIACGEFR